MKKKVFGRQFKRDTNERKALIKSLMNSMLLYEKIETTEAKAKAIKGKLEKLVTKARNKGEASFAYLLKYFSPALAKKLIKNIAPRFINKAGGYLRILRLGHRLKDNAQIVRLEWTEQEKALVGQSDKIEEDRKPGQKLAAGKLKTKKTATKVKKDEKTNQINKNK